MMFGLGYVNASSDINFDGSNPYACWDIADATEASFISESLERQIINTAEQEFAVWQQAYDSCMGGGDDPVIVGGN
ncbi:hypothetical protein [Paucihalobacter sp.]|uniref:hypothetical protein n=1 Tax=Paucihalobacter sp. TaxID=2850405 RepID=UPI003D161F9E